jgi:hypothetical protein
MQIAMGYEIVWVPPNGVIKRHFGQVTGSEILAAVAKTHGHENFDTLSYVINDFRECTELRVSPVEIEEVAAIDNAAAAINPNIRIAVVAIHPDVISAANAYANDSFTVYAVRTFKTMDEARSWLGLSRTQSDTTSVR